MALKSQSIIWIVQINNSNLEKTQSLFIRYLTRAKIFSFLAFLEYWYLKIALLCIFYIIVVFKFQMKKKITSDFIILFLVYCLNSIYIFFFPQNSLRWWRPNSMAGLVCEWRGNSDVICIFVYRRPWIFALKPNTWLFYFIFFSVVYLFKMFETCKICLLCTSWRCICKQ